MTVIRPSDATETKSAWITALNHKTGPVCILLTRQNLPIFDRQELPSACNLQKGAYTIWESGSEPEIIILASGSEVWISIEAGKKLAAEGKSVRVVSFPSWELFEKQDAEYKESVLPATCTCRLSVEAGTTYGWDKYVGTAGRKIGIDHFGASAPGGVLAEKFGINADNVYKTAKEMLA
jgi:transketolase